MRFRVYPTDSLRFDGANTEVEQLEAASRLVKDPFGFAYADRTVCFDVDLPPHVVAAVTLELAPESPDGSEAT